MQVGEKVFFRSTKIYLKVHGLPTVFVFAVEAHFKHKP